MAASGPTSDMKKALAIVWGVWRSGHDFVVPAEVAT